MNKVDDFSLGFFNLVKWFSYININDRKSARKRQGPVYNQLYA